MASYDVDTPGTQSLEENEPKEDEGLGKRNENLSNVITEFKTHHLWQNLSEEEILEEISGVNEWYALGKIRKEQFETTIQRLQERLLEVQVDYATS